MADGLTLIKNRIVGYGEKPADQFQAHPLNWRKHPQRQRAAVEASLRELGWIGVVIENVQTGNLIDGHERVWQALRAGGDVPYIQVDLSPDEEALALATFDAITNMAETDAAKLDELLRDVNTGEAALMELMAETAKDAGLFLEQPDEADAEPQIDRADELRQQWGVELGQLWRLPSRTPGQEHRLICGDCTDAAVVERVMGGERANIIVTDPPWGVDYDGGTLVREKLANDGDASIFARFLPTVPSQDDTPFYCWFALGMSEPTFAAFRDSGWEIRSVIIWNKNQAQFGALSAHYKEKKEPLIYAVRRGKTPKWRGPTNEVTVWDADRKSANKLHPTEKPVELQERAIRNSSDLRDTVYEPFCGSGTTIIAAENLARQCRAVEISPGYVAVALQRYQDAFGITAELVE